MARACSGRNSCGSVHRGTLDEGNGHSGGGVRGKTARTTISAVSDAKPLDLVKREFHAKRPNRLWVADFTYVATWIGFVYGALIIDVFSRMIVGWRVAGSMSADLPLDALEQALRARQVTDGLIHHSDHGSRPGFYRYTERLSEAGIEASVGSVARSYRMGCLPINVRKSIAVIRQLCCSARI
jgi:putative transposase